MQNAEEYKKYVEEHKYIFSNKKQFSYNRDYSLIYPKLSYSQSSNMYTYATMQKINSMYVKNSNYLIEENTEEPTEQIQHIPTNIPTNSRLEFVTKCPTTLNSTMPMPSINLTINNYKSNTENNSNILIITFSIFSFFYFLFQSIFINIIT
jgi:hypothetical protein